MDATKPYTFIGFGAMDATKPYKFIGFGAMDATKPYKFMEFGGMRPWTPGVDRQNKLAKKYTKMDLPVDLGL